MSVWLKCQLVWQRQHRMYWLLGGLLLGNAWAFGFLLPSLQGQQRQVALQLQQERAQLPSQRVRNKPEGSARQRLQSFQQVLDRMGEARARQTVFALAAKSGLRLEEAAYERSRPPGAYFQQLRITLPVKGTYPAIRQFVEQVLLALPNAALDRMTLKRDDVATGTVNASLHIVLFLRPESVERATSPNGISRQAGAGRS